MLKPVKFAVVGCGNIGKRHIAVLDAEEKAEVIGICDINETLARAQAKLYDVPWFKSLEEMLGNLEPDIVCIATPHHLHCQMTVDACNKGVNVLVEKPMALSVKEAMKMNEAAYKNRVKLWVVKQNRYNIPVKITKDIIDENVLGKIFMVKCDVLWNRHEAYYSGSPWRGRLVSEGGALFTQASHFIDLLVWWFGDVASVAGHIDTLKQSVEIEDIGVVSLKFDSGAICSLTWTTDVYRKNYEGSITIMGEKGTIKIGGEYLNKIEFWDVKDRELDPNIDYSDKPNNYGKYQGTSSNHDKVIIDIINDFFGRVPKTVDGFEGMKSIEVIEKIYDELGKWTKSKYKKQESLTLK